MGWRKLLKSSPPASDMASSPSSGKVLKVSSNGTGLEWADDAGGAFSDNGTLASVTDRIVTITGSSSAIPTLDINPPSSVSGTSYSRIRVQTSGRDLRFNLRNGSSTSDVMTIAHSGGVGIGTTDVGGGVIGGAKLDIYQAGSSSDGRIKSRAHDVVSSIGSARGSNRFFSISAGLELMTNSNHPILFSTNVTAGSATPQMILNTSGYLGIGTDSPSEKLHVEGVIQQTKIKIYNSGIEKTGAFGGDTFFIRQLGNNQDIRFQTNKGGSTTTALAIDGLTHNIGIGTESPSEKLHIQGSFNGNVKTLIENTNTGTSAYATLGFQSDENHSVQPALFLNGSNNANYAGVNSLNMYQHGYFPLGFVTNNTLRMIVTGSGNVGVGITNPTSTFDVSGIITVNAQLRSRSGNGLYLNAQGSSGGFSHRFQQAGTDRVVIADTTGYVGIGTTSPSTTLDVNGNIKAGGTSRVYFNTNATGVGSSTVNQLDVFSFGDMNVSTENSSTSIKFKTAGTERVRINEHGLGINATPADDIRLRVKASDNDDGIRLDDSSNNVLFKVFQQSSGVGRMFLRGGGSTVFNLTSGSDASYINIGQNFGIGTTSPSNTLHVSDSAEITAKITSSNSIGSQLSLDADGTGGGEWRLVSGANGAGIGGGSFGIFNNAYRFNITSTGNVGIGTNSPTEKLEVDGNINASSLKVKGTAPAITWEETDMSDIAHKLSMQVNTRALSWNTIGSNGFVSTDYQMHRTSNGAYFHKWFIAGTSRMILNNNGRLGIGTDSPVYGLDVRSTGYFATASTVDQLRLGDTTNGKVSSIRAVNDTMSFKPDGSNTRFFIGNTGKVGIGTTSPSQIFHVRDSANSLDLFSIRSTGSETRIGIGKNSADCAIDFSTGLPNGGGTIQNTFRLDFINNVRVASHNGRLVLQSNNGIRIAGHNDNPSGNYYGLEVKHTRSSTNNDAILNVMKNDGTSLFKITPSSRMSLSNNDAGTQNTTYGNTAGNALASGSQGNSSFGHESMLNTTTGDRNTAVGYQSLRHNSTGSNNVAVGYEALRASSGNSTSNNVAIGNYTLYSINTGSQNVAVGATSLYSNTSGNYNVGVGYESSVYNKTGHNNTAVGYQSLRGVNQQSHSNNTAMGYKSLSVITTGSNNAGFGMESLRIASTGYSNTALGTFSLYDLTTGAQNVSVGLSSGENLSDGNNNVFVGYRAGYSGTSPDGSIGIGYRALYNNTADYNIAIGFDALFSVTTGTGNVAIGYSALQTADNDGRNIAIGQETLKVYNASGDTYNVAIGHRSQYNRTGGVQNTALGAFSQYGGTSGTAPTGAGNTSVGYASLYNLTNGAYNAGFGIQASYNQKSGQHNNMFGYQAGYFNETGSKNTALGGFAMRGASGNSFSNNTAIGYESMYPITTGASNTALGYQSLRAITSGGQNTGIGTQANYSVTTGVVNTAVGNGALFYNQTGHYNTAIGGSAMGGASGNSHDNNTAVGYKSLLNVTTGSNNVSMGYQSMLNTTTGHDSVAIGYDSLKGAFTGDNTVAIGYESGYSITGGRYNTLVGSGSGANITGNSHNTYVGNNAGYSANQSYNVYMGSSAGRYIGGGGNNVALGYEAMKSSGTASNNTSANNTAIGYRSLFSITTGSSNIAIGKEALDAGTTVTSNVAIGNSALGTNITGNYNTAVGQSCLLSNTNSFMTAVGYNALRLNSGGGANVGFGFNAGYGNHTGSNNTYLGYEAGKGVSYNANSNNTGVGKDALKGITTGNLNSAFGKDAGDSVTSGEKNVFIGAESGQNTTSQSNCTFVGYEAGYNAQVSNTTAIGYQALTGLTSGARNLAIGYQSGMVMGTQNDNTFIGFQSGRSTTGSSNVAVGKYTMYEGAGADYNTAIGTNALQNVTSDNNVAIGYNAMLEHEDGTSNTVVGASAMDDSNGHAGYHNSFFGTKSGAGGWTGASHSNTAIGSFSFGGGAKTAGAIYNTTVGRDSLYNLTSGYNNCAFGYRSGLAITQADENSLFGFSSGTTITNGRRNTIIGSNSDVSASGALNQIVLGQGATGVQDNSAIIGNSACADVFMGDNGSAWSTTSDGRLKENIEEWTTGLDAINKLRIVEYNFKEDNPYKYDHKKKRQGIIAQEAIEAIPEMIKDDGEWLTANQEPMIWALVNAVQELTKKVNQLETKLNKEN